MGRFGEPVRVHGQFYYRYPDVPRDWWQLSDRKSSCWVLGDVGTHFIDLLRWYLGDAKTVHGHLSNKAYGRSADYAFLTIGFKNGAVGTVSASLAVTGGGGMELLGTDGYSAHALNRARIDPSGVYTSSGWPRFMAR